MNRHEYKCGGARLVAKRGTELPQSKLTEAQVREIKQAHAVKQRLIDELNARFSAKALAAHYGVHHRTIERILQRDGWIHV